MANSIFGGFMESLGPAIQQGREGQLKQQMLKMQKQKENSRKLVMIKTEKIN